MGITFIGLNHRSAPVSMRERVAFNDTTIPAALDELTSLPGIHEAVILSTCNRCEIYADIAEGVNGFETLSDFLSRAKDVPSKELLPNLYFGEGLDAATHLFNVVCSLDSLVLGEAQILGQVRNAYVVASENGSTKKVLNQLFRQALGVGKGVRTETDLSKSHVSISTVAVDLAQRVFEDLPKRCVLVLGAGEMAHLTARYLAEKNVRDIIVANRTYDRALALSLELGGRAVPFEDLVDCLSLADIVISSTAADHHIITPEVLKRARRKRKGRSLLLIDIAVPRDIDPACGDLDDTYLYSVDDLETIVSKNQETRALAAHDAARMVGEEVREFAGWLEVCDAAPTIRELRASAESIRDAELEKLFKRLGSLDDKDQASIEACANAIVNKLLHSPTKTLREQAGTAEGARTVRTVRELFDLDETE